MNDASDSEIQIRDLAEHLDIFTRESSKNEAMLRCIELAMIACKSSAPVMITGESGVGKSLLATSIHNNSPKRALPCVTLKCSTVHDRDIKARLFGDRRTSEGGGGLLKKAAGGTLIIDAVDQLPGFVQRELLAILRDITERPGKKDTSSSIRDRWQGSGVRLISTSGSELAQKPGQGLFVEDLMYSLGEITIRVPPLRARREDIASMTALTVKAANRSHGKNVKGLSRTASDFIRHYDFPGNVRELFLIINRAVRKTTRDTLYVEDLGLVVDSAEAHPHLDADMTLLPLAEMEKRHINKALLRTGWKKQVAARLLRITVTMLNRKIKLHGLERGTRLD